MSIGQKIKHYLRSAFREIIVYHNSSLEFRAKLFAIVAGADKNISKDEEKIIEFDINSNQAFQEVNSLIISSVKGSLLEEDKFEIDAFENSTTYFVSLIPLDEEMKNILNKIELYFDISSLNISKVKMIENEDDYTIISFTTRKLNESVPANIFILN